MCGISPRDTGAKSVFQPRGMDPGHTESSQAEQPGGEIFTAREFY